MISEVSAKGIQCKPVELRMNGTELEWRQTGGEWISLIDIAKLINEKK